MSHSKPSSTDPPPDYRTAISVASFYGSTSSSTTPPSTPADTNPATPPSNATSTVNVNPSSSTPISNKMSGSQTYSSATILRREANDRLAEETDGLFLGPMPPSSFLNQFLPVDEAVVGSCPDAKSAFKDVAKAESEFQMYAPFIKAAQSFAPELKCVDTHANPDMERDRLAPDIGVYRHDDSPSKTNLSKMEFFVELKISDASDPFSEPKDRLDPQADDFCFEDDNQEGRLIRGQIVAYAAALTGCQFRVHAFSVLICGKFARLIRWDRSGAIVSSRFDYTRRPDVLAGFFWRYAQSTPRQRGHDTSISPATRDEVAHVKPLEKVFKERNPHHRGFCKIMVPDRADAAESKEKPFIVSSPPKYSSRSPFGRATRPMLAFDMETKKVVFLKDYWRADVDGMEKEGDIYARLEEHKVPYIAPFGKGNDLRDHMTVTHTLRNERWACRTKEMVCLRQYRMTLDIVARPLTSFRSSRELVCAIADAMDGHQHAYFDAKILHRDISVGNILITDSGRGLLIDWDLSLNLSNAIASARRPDRTGTWQFMSAALLSDKKKPHYFEDDGESSLYVLLWTAMRYSKSSLSPIALAAMLRLFDEVYEGDDGASGGQLKTNFLLSCPVPKQLKFTDCSPLDTLVRELADRFSVRYEELVPLFRPPEYQKIWQDNMVLRLGDIVARNWLVNTFRKYLDMGGWADDDQAQLQPVGAKTGKKRTNAGVMSESRTSGKKYRKLPGSDNPRVHSEDESNG